MKKRIQTAFITAAAFLTLSVSGCTNEAEESSGATLSTGSSSSSSSSSSTSENSTAYTKGTAVTYTFGSESNQTGATEYSSTTGYGFTAIDGTLNSLTASSGLITATESFEFKKTADNGNYEVTVVYTGADSVISECITDSITYHYTNSAGTQIDKTYTPAESSTGQPYIGIKKTITSGTAFDVAVCDGILDLEFVYGSTSITLSSITITPLSYTARSKPYLIGIGDSTIALGDKTIKTDDTYHSWGACISNGYIDMPSSIGGFINCGESGGDAVTIYVNGRVEKCLLNVCPRDYVSINIGINNNKSYTIAGVSVSKSGSLAAMGPILEKYLIDAVKDGGGIPFITTITPQGPYTSSGADDIDSGNQYYNSDYTVLSSDAYTNSYANSTLFGSTYDLFKGSGYAYYAGSAYSTGSTVTAGTWHNSRHTNAYNIMLLDIANYYGCNVVDLGIYGEKYLNSLNSDYYTTYNSSNSTSYTSNFEMIQKAYYTDQHHYRTVWGNILATYMLECVDQMISGSYAYPYTSYAPNFLK